MYRMSAVLTVFRRMHPASDRSRRLCERAPAFSPGQFLSWSKFSHPGHAVAKRAEALVMPGWQSSPSRNRASVFGPFSAPVVLEQCARDDQSGVSIQ